MTKVTTKFLNDAQHEALIWALEEYLYECEYDHLFRHIGDFPHGYSDAELWKTANKYLGDDTVNKILDNNA